MTAWSIHLEGAATLLKTRGVDTSDCVLGRQGLKLFIQFRSQLVKPSDYELVWSSLTHGIVN